MGTFTLDEAYSPAPAAGAFSLDDAYGPRSETDIRLGGVKAAAKEVWAEGPREVVKSAATLADMVVGIPFGVAGTLAEHGYRAARALDPSISKKSAAEAGKAYREYVTSKAPTWFTDLVSTIDRKVHGREPTPSKVAEAINFLLEKGSDAGRAIERKTGGKVAQEDVEMYLHGVLNALGMKGGMAAAKFGAEVLPSPAKGAIRPREPAAPPAVEPPPVAVVGGQQAEIVEPAAPGRKPRFKLRAVRERGPAVEGEAETVLADWETGISNQAQRGVIDIGKAEKRYVAEPAASTLGVMLNSSQTSRSARTLARLSQNRSEFKKDTVAQLLRRDDVTPAERTAVQEVLDSVEGDTISARQLVAGVQETTKDLKLTEVPTQEYAFTGLDNIGRLERDSSGVPLSTRQRVSLWETPDQLIKEPSPHFPKSKNYFAHSRSFVGPDDARYVVEIQSDLASKWPKRVAEVAEEAKKAEGLLESWREAIRSGMLAGEKLSIAKREMRFLQDDLAQAKEVVARMEALKPLSKHFQKRVAREEVRWAAAEGREAIRFATPETAAKVEGWPREEGGIVPEAQAQIDALLVERSRVIDRFDARAELDEMAAAIAQRDLRAIENRIREVSETADRLEARLSPEHQSIADQYRDLGKYLKKELGAKEITDELGHTWFEVPINRSHLAAAPMLGKVDAKVLAYGGAAALGALVGAYLKGDVDSAAFGAAGGLLVRYLGSKNATLRKAGQDIANGVDYAGGLVSTRVWEMSKKVHSDLVKNEYKTMGEGHARLDQVLPFIEAFERLPKKAKAEVEQALRSADAARLVQTLKRHPTLWNIWDQTVGKTVQELDRRAGRIPRPYWFPRMIKDQAGLFEELDRSVKPAADDAIIKAETQSLRQRGRGLTDREKANILNSFVRGVGPKLEPYYYPAMEGLTNFIKSETKAISRAEFFGRDGVYVKKGHNLVLDLHKSIGKKVERMRKEGKITREQEVELAGILTDRFVGGEQLGWGGWSDLKNVTNLALLGHPSSALVQITDVGSALFTQGLIATVSGAGKALVGRGYRWRDFGGMDHIAEELSSVRATARLVNGGLKLNGFTLVDVFGKNIALNAAANKFQRLAKTEKGIAEIARKYKEAFDTDFPALIQELQSGVRGPHTKFLLFHELSRIQPITKLEVPQAYLANPNGRNLYMLKTYMLKQADIVRRDAYLEMKHGSATRGMMNLFRYATILGLSGASMDWLRQWILGINVDPGPDDLWLNVFKTFGWSEYVLDKARGGEPVEAALGTMVPPYSIVDKIWRDNEKALQYIPLPGLKEYYYREMGGAERYEKSRERLKKRQEKRDAQRQ